MHGVHLQYLCQYMSTYKSVLVDELTRHILYTFYNNKQPSCGVAEKMLKYTVYKFLHCAQVVNILK